MQMTCFITHSNSGHSLILGSEQGQLSLQDLEGPGQPPGGGAQEWGDLGGKVPSSCSWTLILHQPHDLLG